MENRLKVWWMPQISVDILFEVEVKSLREAYLLLKTLAEYDDFQLKNNIKPDYSNTGGLLEFTREFGWTDWEDDCGENFDEYCERMFGGKYDET